MADATMQQLIEACEKHGKDKVLKHLDTIHNAMLGLEADCWADPALHTQARRLQPRLTKQAITIAQLSAMDIKELICKE